VFTVAAAPGFFEGARRVDWDWLNMVRQITGKRDVADQPPTARQRGSCKAMRCGGGSGSTTGYRLEGDLDQRLLRFVALSLL
jgi:hypothetical protein